MPLPERSLISRIVRLSGRPYSGRTAPKTQELQPGAERRKLSPQIGKARLVTGIGDDCAVLRPAAGADLLVTTDFSLEGVHFRRNWHPPESIGHRCLARGLSDIAAMGGDPVAAFLSLAIPSDLPQAWADRFLKGLLILARQFGIPLAGGDTSQSPSGVLADIMLIGSVPKGRAILRSGARPGDQIYVTGALGQSAAALRLLYSGRKINRKKFPRHFSPIPRVESARVIRSEKLANSMIDLSDGLSTDLAHICEESRVGAEIWAKAIPISRAALESKTAALELALHGGEDYELLFTAAARARVPSPLAGVPVTCIGQITRGKRIFLVDAHGSRTALKPGGWEHFRDSSAAKPHRSVRQ